MDAREIIRRCRAIAECTEEPGWITRPFGSAALARAQELVARWMQEAGLQVRRDSVGNLFGIRGPGPRLMIGSHLDSVPRAGAFDGVLGVVMGIALAGADHVEVAAFAEEENSFLGSKTLVNNWDDAVKSYLEFHIEQGPVLDSMGLPLGVVEAIAGQTRCELRFTGAANHAGTTPMNLRRDALAGAAEWLGRVEREAESTKGLVATVGRLQPVPGAGNVIAGSAFASLDVRHADDGVRNRAVESLLQGAREIAQRRGLAVKIEVLLEQPAAPLRHAWSPLPRLVSGAGHDAMIVAQKVPASMVFLRSPGGISHHPDEAVREEDIAVALEVGRQYVASWRPE